MDQFNIRQKDVYNFDDFMDLKKPGFGGPDSGIKFDAKKEPKQLKGWRRVVKRYAPTENGTFNPNYNGHWAAINKDRATRDAGVEEETESKYVDDLKHGRALPTYESFVKHVFEAQVDTENPADEVEEYDSQDKKKSEEMDVDSAVGEFNELQEQPTKYEGKLKVNNKESY